MLKLDERDLKILSILREEGRISKADLARRVNLSAAPCWERLQRLEKAGIIKGYHADVALKKLGAHIVVFMAAELEQHRAEDFQIFERAMELARYFPYVVTKPVKQSARLPLDLIAKGGSPKE